MSHRRSLSLRAVLVLGVVGTVSGCNFLDRLSEVGEPPRTSRVEDPTQAPNYKPVSMPMPTPTAPPSGTNSLWRSGARAFFKDQRAAEIGDIVTVTVDINDSGQLVDKTQTSTASSETAAMPDFLGFAANDLHRVFAGTNANSNLVDLSSSSGINGQGTMQRQEQVTVNLAATVTQKLPNGNLVISGKQELRVNGDMREVSVQGIIRAEDISTTNTITSDKIAEARITYGGRGTLSDIQQPRYGQQIFDLVAPF